MLGRNGELHVRLQRRIDSQANAGKVGNGMLAAAVSGEVFASPSAKQVMAAIEHSPSDVGIILCITNYTGDNLHFGLAKEKALGMGKKVAILRMTDDVALGRQQTSNLGRRGLAGNLFGKSDHVQYFCDAS
jgi:dihydroxyacetone kinase